MDQEQNKILLEKLERYAKKELGCELQEVPKSEVQEIVADYLQGEWDY